MQNYVVYLGERYSQKKYLVTVENPAQKDDLIRKALIKLVKDSCVYSSDPSWSHISDKDIENMVIKPSIIWFADAQLQIHYWSDILYSIVDDNLSGLYGIMQGAKNH